MLFSECLLTRRHVNAVQPTAMAALLTGIIAPNPAMQHPSRSLSLHLTSTARCSFAFFLRLAPLFLCHHPLSKPFPPSHCPAVFPPPPCSPGIHCASPHRTQIGMTGDPKRSPSAHSINNPIQLPQPGRGKRHWFTRRASQQLFAHWLSLGVPCIESSHALGSTCVTARLYLDMSRLFCSFPHRSRLDRYDSMTPSPI